jgi:hypothetical protein
LEVIDNNNVRIDRELSLLDRFVLDAVSLIRPWCKYVIVSGYVSIVFGRPRGTEDIDMLVESLDKTTFLIMYDGLLKHGYWCLNSESQEKVYGYVRDRIPIRLAKRGTVFPNIELQIATTKAKELVLNDPLVVHLGENRINVSAIEYQVLYKRMKLSSFKDIEDARWLEELFKGHIDNDKMVAFKELLANED